MSNACGPDKVTVVSLMFTEAVLKMLCWFFCAGSHNSQVQLWKCAHKYHGLEPLFSIPVVSSSLLWKGHICISCTCSYHFQHTSGSLKICHIISPSASTLSLVLSTVLSFQALVSSWWPELDRSTGNWTVTHVYCFHQHITIHTGLCSMNEVSTRCQC